MLYIFYKFYGQKFTEPRVFNVSSEGAYSTRLANDADVICTLNDAGEWKYFKDRRPEMCKFDANSTFIKPYLDYVAQLQAIQTRSETRLYSYNPTNTLDD